MRRHRDRAPSHAAYTQADIVSVGVTVLPGHPLPQWAPRHAAPTAESLPDSLPDLPELQSIPGLFDGLTAESDAAAPSLPAAELPLEVSALAEWQADSAAFAPPSWSQPAALAAEPSQDSAEPLAAPAAVEATTEGGALPWSGYPPAPPAPLAPFALRTESDPAVEAVDEAAMSAALFGPLREPDAHDSGDPDPADWTWLASASPAPDGPGGGFATETGDRFEQLDHFAPAPFAPAPFAPAPFAPAPFAPAEPAAPVAQLEQIRLAQPPEPELRADPLGYLPDPVEAEQGDAGWSFGVAASIALADRLASVSPRPAEPVSPGAELPPVREASVPNGEGSEAAAPRRRRHARVEDLAEIAAAEAVALDVPNSATNPDAATAGESDSRAPLQPAVVRLGEAAGEGSDLPADSGHVSVAPPASDPVSQAPEGALDSTGEHKDDPELLAFFAAPSAEPTTPSEDAAQVIGAAAAREVPDEESEPSHGAKIRARRAPVAGLVGRIAAALMAAAATGGAVYFALETFVFNSDQTAQVAQVEAQLALPGKVAGEQRVAAAEADAALQAMVGLPTRPAGVTTVAGFGDTRTGPVDLAVRATSLPQAVTADRLNTVAAGLGLQLGKPRSGSTAGVTWVCAPAAKTKKTAAGAVCLFDNGTARGQTFVVGAKPQAAGDETVLVAQAVLNRAPLATS